MRPLRLVLLPAVVVASACSSSGSTNEAPKPCNLDPWQCPAGQTCWPSDLAGNFQCLNSDASKKKGDTCDNFVGVPSCGDGLACLRLVGASSGRCLPFCDPEKVGHGCVSGEACQQVMVSGTTATYHVCVGPETSDAGPDTGTDSGSDGGADASTDTRSDVTTDGAATDGGADATDAPDATVGDGTAG